jgi:IclR family transcriptional regulator, mhp operon transcriptional activator
LGGVRLAYINRNLLLRSLARGLSVLRHLNEGGASSVVEIANAVGLSRPAVYRALEELCRTGYVRKSDANSRYEITHLVRRLSHGFSEEGWIREIAAPVLRELQRRIIWPADLATLFDGAMYLSETTRVHSPLTIDRASVGLRLPLLFSATGRAYLAFCPESERDSLLTILARSSEPLDAKAKDQRWINSMLRTVRTNGYGHRFGDFMPETGAIAVPIRHGNRILACLNITFIASALSPEQAAQRHLPDMLQAVRSIEAEVLVQFDENLADRSRRTRHNRHTAAAKKA